MTKDDQKSFDEFVWMLREYVEMEMRLNPSVTLYMALYQGLCVSKRTIEVKARDDTRIVLLEREKRCDDLVADEARGRL
jgi:hypothetical protein